MIKELTDSSDYLGAKAGMIKKINEIIKKFDNVLIPESLIVSSEYFDRHLKSLSSAERSVKIKKDLLKEIRKKFGNKALVIRSSATCEDSIFFSGAGIYDSFLNISSDEEIVLAITKTYESFDTPNADFYADFNEIDYSKESMAILIQELAPIKTSGVLFTRDPVTESSEIQIEQVSGLGDSVVSGCANLKTITYHKNEINNVKDPLIKQLIIVAYDLEKELGFPVDVEWGCNDSHIYIFQARPIIFNKQKKNCLRDEKSIISKGISIGRVQYLNKTTNSENKIIVRNKKCTINDILQILHSRGFIISDGGRLSHFANILREFSLPCLFIEESPEDTDSVFVLDAYLGKFQKFEDLTDVEADEYLWDYLDEIYEMFNFYSYRYKQIRKMNRVIKYETVVFDVSEENVEKMEKNSLEHQADVQRIWTYDLKDGGLFSQKTILRIQMSFGKTLLQIKKLGMENGFRRECEYILEFDNFENAEQFILSLGLHRTGYQERKLNQYIFNDYQCNVIEWPNKKPYLGIECGDSNMFEQILKSLGYNNKKGEAIDGKEIFDKLDLSLNNCSFDKE